MDCQQALALLLAHMDRELQPEDRPRLEAHFRECERCRASAEVYRSQDADLRRAFAPRRQASAAVAERTIARLRLQGSHASRAPRGSSWWTVILAAAAGFLVAVLLFRPWSQRPQLARDSNISAPETVRLALATNAKEGCEFLAPGETTWRVLQLGGEIVLGSRVRTKPEVRCEFRTRDGSELRVNGDTELVFAERRRIQLDKGQIQILARVVEAAAPFQVGIPQATITSLGTEFDLLCKPVESVLTVLEGATRVEGKDQWRTIQTGEQATILEGPDGLVVRKRVLQRYAQVVSWADELLRLKGPTNKESLQRITRKLDDLLAELGSLKGDPDFPEEQVRSLGAHAVLPLTRFLQSERYKTAQEKRKRERVARILADLAQPWSVPDLIELLGDNDNEVRLYAATALQRLTKQTQGYYPSEWRDRDLNSLKPAREAWRKWWAENKKSYPDPEHIADGQAPNEAPGPNRMNIVK
jgi:hypothetical protein